MKNLRTLLLIGCFAYFGVSLTPKAKAGEWDQKPILTFDQPVEIPGIVLPAGTYVFNFLGSTADRDLIDVLSQDEQKVYATVEAIPDYRANATGETSIVFEERKAGAPHAIKEWFFPDPRYGHEFVYPEMGALELGKISRFDSAGKISRSDSANNLIESAGLHSTEASWTRYEPGTTMEHSAQMVQPEETDYLRVLHQKQVEACKLAKADESANRPTESAGLSYLQVLRQKQMKH